MPYGGMQASSHPLRWPLRSRTTVAIASGLILLLFTVSHRFWRGGGRKACDPGGTKSSKKVKGRKGQVKDSSEDLENFSVSSGNEVSVVDCQKALKTNELQTSLDEVVNEEYVLPKEGDVPLENFFEERIERKELEASAAVHVETTEERCIKHIVDRSYQHLVSVKPKEEEGLPKELEINEQISPEIKIEETILSEKQKRIEKSPSTSEESALIVNEVSVKQNRHPSEWVNEETSEKSSVNLKIVEEEKIEEPKVPDSLIGSLEGSKDTNLAAEGPNSVSIIHEVRGSISEEIVPTVVSEEDKDLLKEGEISQCLKEIEPEKVAEEHSLLKEKIEPVKSLPLSSEVVVKEKEDSQPSENSEPSIVVDGEGSNSASESISREVISNKPVEEEVMQVNHVKSDIDTNSNPNIKSSGKKKGGKRNKEVHKVELKGSKTEMEVKEMTRDSVENEVVGEVEEHPSKCEVSASQVPLDATGLSSPSISNFPDNRSEGSSCGDSGKGRSDVTTPGGLEEEEREVSFSRHFSPPCSTSGPEEEEEEEDDNRNDAGEGDPLDNNTSEAVMLANQAGVLLDGSLMPVGVSLPVYPGIVPVTPSSVYEFVIPQGLVGRLIGKHGTFVNLIKERTSASIFIKTHPESSKLKVCAIEGSDSQIQAALAMIREKFPQKRYSSMTLEQVFFLPLPPPTLPLIPDSLQLQLIEGVSNDVILSAMVSPSHYFLQQPTHPTYPVLAKLDMWMAFSYQDANAPMLPNNVEPGIICAAPTMGGWYRAQIVAVDELPATAEDGSAEEGELVKWCDVRFVDYGGYERLPVHSLRQIRRDFMTLPFQASECYLASVIPAPTTDENKTADGWSMEAYNLVEEFTQAQVIQAQVVGHSHDGLPLVFLYAYSHSMGQIVQVNGELVRRGLASWIVPVVEMDHIIDESTSEQETEEEGESKEA